MASRVLNIEVGDSICKVCCSQAEKKCCRVSESFMFITPADSVTDGTINNAEVLADMLRLELESHGLGNVKGVVFSVASGKIASREIKLPYLKDKQLADAIATNSADYFPVDITRYHVTHLLLERVKGSEGFCRVLVMAAPLSLLEGYFRLADLARLDIKAIDSCSNSHYQAIRRLKEPTVSMYVDVDCTASFVSFIAGDELLLQRTFAFGGDELITAYMEKKDYGEGDFIRALREVSVSSADFAGEESIGESNIKDGLNRLVYSVVRSVDYFNSFRWEAVTAQIVLMGACGHVAGLKEQVAAATDLPVIYLEEVPGAQKICEGADISAYISCIGSNLAPVDFMPEILKRRKRGAASEVGEQTLIKGIIGGSILVLAAIAVSALALLNYQLVERRLAETRDEIARLEPAEQVYLTYNAYQQGELAMLQVRELEESPNASLVAFFEELEEKMPSQILLLSAVCTADGISMSVTVPGFEEAAVVISQLRSFESLSEINVSDVTTQTDESGAQYAVFTVVCAYGTNPYLNDINPYSGIIAQSSEEEALQ